MEIPGNPWTLTGRRAVCDIQPSLHLVVPSLINKSGQTISSICERLRACSRIRKTLFMLTYCVVSVGPTAPTHIYTPDRRLYGNYTAARIPFPRSHCADRLHTRALTSTAFQKRIFQLRQKKRKIEIELRAPTRQSAYHGDIPTRNCSFRYTCEMVANSKNQKSKTEKREKENSNTVTS